MTAKTLVPGVYGRQNGFRSRLPENVRARLIAPLPQFEPEVEAAMARQAVRSPDMHWRRITAQDLRDFLLAYCACFIALQAFFA